MPLTFEQQPNETAKAFAAFKLYLELGPERSLVAVGKQLGKGVTVIERWSRKFNWPARVQAHNAHLAMVELKAAEAVATRNGVDWGRRQQEHREEEWQARTELLSLAHEAIQRWKKNEKRCGTLEGIARLLDLASKLGRVSSGLALEPADKPPEENGALMIQIEVALEKIYGAAELAVGPQARPAPVIDVEAGVIEAASGGRGKPAGSPAQT
jgi:hypothetical protein